MSYIKHNAIIVQGYSLKESHIEIRNILRKTFNDKRAEDLVSNIVQNYINGGESFFICSDGSKESWEVSYLGDLAREKIVDYLRDRDLDFIEVAFGGDDKLSEIIN